MKLINHYEVGIIISLILFLFIIEGTDAKTIAVLSFFGLMFYLVFKGVLKALNDMDDL